MAESLALTSSTQNSEKLTWLHPIISGGLPVAGPVG